MSEKHEKRSRRQWLQFRLSTILLVVLLCAVAAVWQRNRIELVRLKSQLQETQQSQQSLAAALAKVKADLALLRSTQATTTYRDKHGILRSLDGRPVGIWGVDEGNSESNMPAVR